MYRTDLATGIKTLIDESTPDKWPGALKLGTAVLSTDDAFVPVKVALDPFTDAKILQPHVFIIPGYKQFGEKQRRRDNSPTKDSIFITVALSVRLTETVTEDESYDISPMTEWSKWMNLKDDLDKFLYNLADYSSLRVRINEPIEPEPADEISLDSRFYLETTVIGYESC